MGSLAVDESGKRASVGYIVFNGEVPGLVQSCVLERGSLMLAVQAFHNVEVGS